MIRKITLLLVALFVYSCDNVNYESETRLVAQGQLTDHDGNPLANREIDIAIFDDKDQIPEFDYYTSPRDVISYGYTNATGHFKLAFPAPKGENLRIGIRINKYAVGYQQKQFLNIKSRDFIGYRYDLGAVALYKTDEVSRLVITPSESDPTHELLEISVEGLMADDFVYVNPITNNLFDLAHLVRTNQTVAIHYRVKEYSGPSAIVTENTVNVAIGTDSTTNYTLNY